MDLSKFTERSRGFIQAAQTIAMRESHQKLAPEHILKALMDDTEGWRVTSSNARAVHLIAWSRRSMPRCGRSPK